MTGRINKKIGEILIEDGLLTPSQLEEALAFQKDHGGLIGEILVEMKFVAEDHLTGALSKQFRIPYVPLKTYSVNPDMAELLTPEFCQENLLVAFDSDAKKVWIALADPLNADAVEKVKNMTHRVPQVFISRISDIKDAIYSLFHEKA